MNLAGLDLEGLDRLHHQGGHEAGAIALEESIQGPAQRIVSQMLRRTQSGIVRLDPLLNAVEGVGPTEHALDEHLQALDVVGGADLQAEQGRDLQGPQEMIHQGQSALQFFFPA